MDPLSLRELNLRIKACLDENFTDSYWVIAEIGELHLNQRGHCYMELVEKSDDEILAKIRATIWSYTYRNLSGWFESITHESLRPGMNILANGVVNFHPVFGLSLNIRDIDPKYTLGERARRRQEIWARLKEDGIAEMNKEIQLPDVPQCIALIASPTSAGYQDFMEQLKYNMHHYAFSVTLFPAVMQGREAEKSLIMGMMEAHKHIDKFDLLVIIRGGGATVDLDCFDSYNLASHVAQYPIPVITGIGHERDETITDLVANTSLKTPTAVAEFMIAGCRQFEDKIDELLLKLTELARGTIDDNKFRLEDRMQKLRFSVKNCMERNTNQWKNAMQKINFTVIKKTTQMKNQLDINRKAILRVPLEYLEEQRILLMNIDKRIELLDPVKVLKRGYSITRKNGLPVKDAGSLSEGDVLETRFYKGKTKSKIIR